MSEARTFYSRASHLGVTIDNPVSVIENGQLVRSGGKSIEFKPLGDGFGWYVTSDAEEIRVLENRATVLSPEQYSEMTTPPSVRLIQEREEKNRLLVANNRLQAELEEIKARAARPAQPQK